MRICELPLHERPANRIADHGLDALSDASCSRWFPASMTWRPAPNVCVSTRAGSGCFAPTYSLFARCGFSYQRPDQVFKSRRQSDVLNWEERTEKN
jgi:hypothetical protein